MQGAGNDFIVFDNLDGLLSLDTEQIRHLCDRRFGIGADGVILLERTAEPELDARMIYYNSDGSRGEMCGNGARCFTAFALSRGVGQAGGVRFLSDAGAMAAAVEESLYTIQMTPPIDLKPSLLVPLAKDGQTTVHYVNTGVPHVVRFVDDIAQVDIHAEGSELRHHPTFAPKGANANFAQLSPGDGVICIRTYERGVEAETLACGTGVTATAILAHLIHGVAKPVRVRVAGGDVLSVDFERDGTDFHSVTLTGPAQFVFEGQIDLAEE